MIADALVLVMEDDDPEPVLARAVVEGTPVLLAVTAVVVFVSNLVRGTVENITDHDRDLTGFALSADREVVEEIVTIEALYVVVGTVLETRIDETETTKRINIEKKTGIVVKTASLGSIVTKVPKVLSQPVI